ncbi:MAG: hypothetical protein M3Y88_08615 [Chloroflexota bacterium]|nr:hypothetical protein [Chloroflexota bacterium]
MAGTMPHAVFVETGIDQSGTVAAYAAELPGCATFASTDAQAVAEIPLRVARFTAWLREHGEQAPEFIGDNWYEVERSAAVEAEGAQRRAAFSLDELPPSDQEFRRYARWLELAREELADAIDAIDSLDAQSSGPPLAVLDRLVQQDLQVIGELSGSAPNLPRDPVDRLYAARDALTETLEREGPAGEGVRRAIRLAIADDLHAAELLREGTKAGTSGE